MIPFSGLSRFSGLFDGDGPSPLNRDTTVLTFKFQSFPHGVVKIGGLQILFQSFPHRFGKKIGGQ